MNKLLLGLSVFLLLEYNACAAKTGGLTLEQRMALLEETPGSCRKKGGKSRKNVKKF